MWENGFIQARMVRARLLHYFICKLVGEWHSSALLNCLTLFYYKIYKTGT